MVRWCRDDWIVATNLNFPWCFAAILLSSGRYLRPLDPVIEAQTSLFGKHRVKVKQNPCQDKHVGPLYLPVRLGENLGRSLGLGGRCRPADRCRASL